MNQEQPAVGYDDFFPKSTKERIKIFSAISAENRAYLVRTHVERWLAANRSRLVEEPVAVVEEAIRSISPVGYKDRQNIEEISPEAKALEKKFEAVFPREDMRQFATEQADYIPVNQNDSTTKKAAPLPPECLCIL